MAKTGAQDWVDKQVREWLWLLLRFAVTLDPRDQSAALTLAHKIDAFGLPRRSLAPFHETTSEVCKAITAIDDPKRMTVLEKHIARIEALALGAPFKWR